MARDPITGPDSGPEAPFPIQLNGRIVKGFGRGSKELGIPTANLPIAGLDVGGHTEIVSGVYYAWASICLRGAVGGAAEASGAVGSEQSKSGGNIKETSSTGSAPANDDYVVYPAVLSIGYNPYYKNEVRSVEVHIMHKFESDFYNAMMNLSILGFIRVERDYDSMKALIDDINFDIEVARRSLDREAYVRRKESDHYLKDFSWG